jgi:hypothetical protein
LQTDRETRLAKVDLIKRCREWIWARFVPLIDERYDERRDVRRRPVAFRDANLNVHDRPVP